jgi:hypothetical protein
VRKYSSPPKSSISVTREIVNPPPPADQLKKQIEQSLNQISDLQRSLEDAESRHFNFTFF